MARGVIRVTRWQVMWPCFRHTWLASTSPRRRATKTAGGGCMRGRENQMDRSFSQFATYSSNLVGSPAAFLVALFTILGWFAVGPIFHFSDTWQLIINSWTNIA